MIRDAKTLLRTRMDKLMTTFRLSNGSFFAGYQSARMIVDLRAKGPSEEQTPSTPDECATNITILSFFSCKPPLLPIKGADAKSNFVR